MKKFLAIIIPLLALLTAICQFSSCEKYILPELSIVPDTLTFNATPDSSTLQVLSNVKWSCTSGAESDWYQISPTEGNGNGEVMIKVNENGSQTERSATVAISSETIRKTFLIIQQGQL